MPPLLALFPLELLSATCGGKLVGGEREETVRDQDTGSYYADTGQTDDGESHEGALAEALASVVGKDRHSRKSKFRKKTVGGGERTEEENEKKRNGTVVSLGIGGVR